MSDLGRANDRLSTGPAVPGAILRLCLPAAAVLAALLLPVIGWQIAVIGLAVVGMLFPQTFAGWGSIAGVAIGLLLAEPHIWQAMAAVLLVHVIHVLSSLLPVLPWRGAVVLIALRPTLLRLLAVQAIAQAVTLAVMLVHDSGAVVSGAALVGAAAFAVFTIVILIRLDGRSRGA